MANCRLPTGILILCSFFWISSGLANAQPSLVTDVVPFEQQFQQAMKYERQGHWSKALQAHLELYTRGQSRTELRDHIRQCLRHLSQEQRQRDPEFRDYLNTLSTSEALSLYTEVLQKIHTLYADRNRSQIDQLFLAGIQELDQALSDRHFHQGLNEANELKIRQFQQDLRDRWSQRLPNSAREARYAAKELVLLAQEKLGLTKPNALLFELLCGACASLDEFSHYDYSTATTPTRMHPLQVLATYGVILAKDDNGAYVESLIPESWAALHTALEPGDRIFSWNQVEIPNLTLEQLQEALVQAKPGHHELQLHDQHPLGMEGPLVIKLPTPLPTVYGSIMHNTKDGIGYLRLAEFKESTSQELEANLLAFQQQGLKALILDLRGNPGGLLTSAIEAAETFLPSGIILTTQGRDPEFANRVISSDRGMSAFDLPLVILVDSRTMSAAEVFALAMKDNHRATLIGMVTFGKGYVQTPIRLESLSNPIGALNPKAGVLVLSVGSMFGPRGTAIQGIGVIPHITEPSPDAQLRLAISKALEILNGINSDMR